MNKQVHQAICDFYNSVWEYMKMEYKPKWARLYNHEKILNQMIQITGEYYLGGNTVPNTAGDIIAVLKKQVENDR